MKKFLVSLFLLLSLVVLASCHKAVKSEQHGTATLIVKFDKATVKTYENVPIKTDETVLDFLESKARVTLKSGIITEIDNVSQIESANRYWLFKVNGKLADKGVTETIVKAGSQIEFYLGEFK
ncbi:DUF4430 domain-containing protein [Pseudolactococcus reticulitermitis]|uniref:Transcobalamin-like C-terminal domain-containing protein n=1 Tax=Pseudolactococcus reticulitermitis TaxID=2025039 RepID=A0A224X9T1_9LACT|nr:DUF4430 domain-containing protein [Lactococcus reticulitermitis]GAX46934.1 hypothetical protein RsY01_514 [Lactococcus reticulitermitis]